MLFIKNREGVLICENYFVNTLGLCFQAFIHRLFVARKRKLFSEEDCCYSTNRLAKYILLKMVLFQLYNGFQDGCWLSFSADSIRAFQR